MKRIFKNPGIFFFLFCAFVAFGIGKFSHPTWTVEKISLDIQTDEYNRLYYLFENQQIFIPKSKIFPAEKAYLTEKTMEVVNQEGIKPKILQEYTSKTIEENGKEKTLYFLNKARDHWRIWSLLPALMAIVLCWITKEPILSLFSGIVVAALILGKYNITEAILVPELSTPSAAGVIVLYLWLLGGLMGIWSKTGAAHAFARLMIKHFVRGPKSAMLVSWCLGIIFFQGGTVSAVLVGTSVKPIADENHVSHEELSYIVDSTSSPIAALIAFNAWPGYIQSFIYVAGVSWLATETDRVAFFFQSLPFSYYALLAVTGTFLLSIEKAPFLGKRMRKAIKRARTTGHLDAPGAVPLSAPELQVSHVPHGYHPAAWEFFIPLSVLIGISIGTFIYTGTPHARTAFGLALIIALACALMKGMSIKHALEGIGMGLKGVVVGSVILLLAIIIGSLSGEVGGGLYLVDLLGSNLPYWTLPVILQLITMIISFSTGTSWGTYAITFPLAMPLSWAVATSSGLEHLEIFMSVCFAAVLNGSLYGDQCSPISDTTILSAMSSGCDLMDHVKTQLPQASAASLISGILWTLTVLFLS